MRCLKIYLLTLILTSCAITAPQTETLPNQTLSWSARVHTLSSINNWDISGLIAIRNPKDNVSASINWQQQGRNYSLNLFGPMGSNAYKLTGSANKVTLQNPRGEKFYAGSPELLLAQQTGWHLPVSNLYYWIRGLPVPGVPAQKRLDASNHLVQLDQAGWQIQFLRYTSVHHIDLPNKIFIHSNDLTVKLIIGQWQLN